MSVHHSKRRVNFTKGRVEAFECPPGAAQVFLWDSGQPGLGLRATPGHVAYVFRAKLHGRGLRMTIGDRNTWDIKKAREEGKRLALLVDMGIDPRAERLERRQAEEAGRQERQRAVVTFGQAWDEYVEERGPTWSRGHRHNHAAMMKAPGEPRPRGKKKTRGGALHPLRDERLQDLTAGRLAKWLETETKARPTVAALGFRMLRAFLRWANDRPAYQGLMDPAVLLTGDVRRKVARQKPKGDVLQREQLRAWFEQVGKIGNPVVRAYLQALLLTGARPGELAMLRWDDVDFEWNSLTIRDKADGQRTIPLPPYTSELLKSLPRRRLSDGSRNPWVFSSPTTAHGRMGEQNHAHTRAVAGAGLPQLTLHGLRRSFGTLAEWVEMPAGITAQIMGHKPSAIAEKHYRRRPLDLLRVWHEKIEGWILKEAGIAQGREPGTSVEPVACASTAQAEPT